MPIPSDRVRFNVGGQIFETTSTTLANAGNDSMFRAMLDENWNLPADSTSREHFIDRNPWCFSVLLDLLRTGELHIPAGMSEKLLYREASYYGLLDHVRSAKWGRFDGNRLRLAGSVTGRAPGDGAAIRASPDGGCCVAHGCMVHVYDWMMQEHAPINLDYQRVNDACYIDTNNIVIGVSAWPGRDGGMGFFSSSTGELKHRLQVNHDNQPKSFTVGALTISADGKIFASCRGRNNEYGIGVWDEETGRQVDFFYDSPCWSLGEADRLQWLNASNCLMAATSFPRKNDCYINVLDFREKRIVWSWTDRGARRTQYEKQVVDVVMMEESSSVCVVNQRDELGFMDIRNNNAGVIRWSSRSLLLKGNLPDELCYPMLAAYGGQLFSSMNDSISVFSGPDWVLTSSLRRSNGGPICGFSIGGNRLFALHSEKNVFDVWETKPIPSII